MEWDIVKLDILAMAFEDYDPVSSHNFILSVSNFKEIADFRNSHKSKDYVLLMLYELMHDGLININYDYEKVFLTELKSKEEIKEFVDYIDTKWKKTNYAMPNWDELFDVVATDKGKEYYFLNETDLE